MIDPDPLIQELLALESMGDDEIDTSEIPIRSDFSGGTKARFFHLTSRDYDIRAIANWCIRRAKLQSKCVSNLWLNKIVFFIYEEALTVNHVLLSPAKAEAWDHGPVFREIYFGLQPDGEARLLKTFDPLSMKKVEADEDFELSDIAIFEGVWSRLGHKSGSQLRNLSHAEGSPWHRVWNYAGKSNPGMLIEIATIIGISNSEQSRDT